MKGLIEYDGKVENYLDKLIAVSTKKQGEILETMRDECEHIIEKYWYTLLLSELIIVSFQEHHRENNDHYQIVIQKWMGIWTRFQETLNLWSHCIFFQLLFFLYHLELNELVPWCDLKC